MKPYLLTGEDFKAMSKMRHASDVAFYLMNKQRNRSGENPLPEPIWMEFWKFDEKGVDIK